LDYQRGENNGADNGLVTEMMQGIIHELDNEQRETIANSISLAYTFAVKP